MRLLVAGGGLIGQRHIRHAAEHPDIDLVGVVDPDPDIRADAPAPAFPRLDHVDTDADAIVIATPTQLHADHAEMAVDRQWHILVEKPIAGSLADADRIVAAGERSGLHILVGHHRRYHPRVAALKALLEEGAIGRPVVASLMWALRKPDHYFEVAWRAGTNGSPVLVNLIHDVDLLRFLFGEIEHVSGVGRAMIRRRGRVESGSVALGFDAGLTATIAFADTTPSPWAFEAGTGENPNIAATGQDMLHIAGTDGAISFPSLRLWSGARDWSEAPIESVRAPVDEGVPLVRQLDHFRDVVAGRTAPLISATDARRTLAATIRIEAATEPGGPGS